jgi:branched-chain amino acid transport system permease protein
VVSALLAGVALYLLGAALHPGLLERVTGARVSGTDGEGHYPQLILTLGISLVMANGGLLLFGSTQYTIKTELSSSAPGLRMAVG